MIPRGSFKPLAFCDSHSFYEVQSIMGSNMAGMYIKIISFLQSHSWEKRIFLSFKHL